MKQALQAGSNLLPHLSAICCPFRCNYFLGKHDYAYTWDAFWEHIGTCSPNKIPDGPCKALSYMELRQKFQFQQVLRIIFHNGRKYCRNSFQGYYRDHHQSTAPASPSRHRPWTGELASGCSLTWDNSLKSHRSSPRANAKTPALNHESQTTYEAQTTHGFLTSGPASGFYDIVFKYLRRFRQCPNWGTFHLRAGHGC